MYILLEIRWILLCQGIKRYIKTKTIISLILWCKFEHLWCRSADQLNGLVSFFPLTNSITILCWIGLLIIKYKKIDVIYIVGKNGTRHFIRCSTALSMLLLTVPINLTGRNCEQWSWIEVQWPSGTGFCVQISHLDL
jgi:hypothetical protein